MHKHIKIEMIGKYATWNEFVTALYKHRSVIESSVASSTRVGDTPTELVNIVVSVLEEPSDDT